MKNDIRMNAMDKEQDAVTALLNYAHTREYMTEYMNEQGASGAVFMVDIDNFQLLNETTDYLFGDRVLVSVATILKKVFSETDIIGRHSGDRFLVLMKGVHADELIKQKGDQICCEAQQIYIGEHLERISVSIGIVRLTQEKAGFDCVCKKAEQALYYAKSKGKNYCQFYEENMSIVGDAFRLRHEIKANAGKGSYDAFYNEIAELAFQLMEDTTDADSSIIHLLQKVKDYFGFAVVSVQEVVADRPRTLKIVYNLVEQGIIDLKDIEVEIEKEKWLYLKSMLEQGRHIFELPADTAQCKEVFLDDREAEAICGLRLTMGEKGYFSGIACYLYTEKSHQWEEQEIHFLEAFTRILSVYINRVRTFDEAKYLARMMRERDSVTGLFSYDTFLNRMKEYVAIQKEPCEIVYTYSDFSNFKYINDTYGYEVGNTLLRKFGEFVLDDDNEDILCASRVHSDNIVVARKNSAGLSPEEFAAQIDICNAYIADVLKEYGHDSMISIRSGICVTKSNEITVEEAVTNAGYACKRNKDRANDKCMIFTDALMQEYKKQLRYISELERAMATGEMQVYLQPKILAKDNRVVGGEALIRWIKPDNTMIFPGEFIPVFEKSGDIITLDYFVYKEVCKYLKGRMDAGLPVVPISVNVSTLHLKNLGIIEYLEGLLAEYNVPARYLELELTENVYIDDVGQALKLLAWCKERGIRMAMDDFGAGYSSLNILDVVPIDVMKIDRSFMKNQVLTRNDKIILECVVNMADKLDIITVCEGVENAEQLVFLRNIGCDIIQGFYIGKPMPISAFDKFLEENTIANAV